MATEDRPQELGHDPDDPSFAQPALEKIKAAAEQAGVPVRIVRRKPGTGEIVFLGKRQ